jgi:hypothetical protein
MIITGVSDVQTVTHGEHSNVHSSNNNAELVRASLPAKKE